MSPLTSRGSAGFYLSLRGLFQNGPFLFRYAAVGATIRFMGDCDSAQAMELVRALHDVVDEMTRKLAWLEHCGARLEAAALRLDINEAQMHISRLQRRYLGGDRRAPVRQLAKQAR